MNPVPKLRVIVAVQFIEFYNYDLYQLMNVVKNPRHNLEYLIAEAAYDPEFWLMIDSNYCENYLTTYRTDVPSEKWRSFVEGFVLKKVFIYTIKHEWDPQIPFLVMSDEITSGYRGFTYPEVAKELHDRTFSSDESGIQYMGIQLTDLEATPGCYGFAWEMSYTFYLVDYPDKQPRRICLFPSKEDSLTGYDKVIDNLTNHIHYVCHHDGLDFDVPAHDIGFIIDDGENEQLIPSQLSKEDIKQHLLLVFDKEDKVSLRNFSEDGTCYAMGYLVYVYNIMPDDRVNVGLEFSIEISQLRF